MTWGMVDVMKMVDPSRTEVYVMNCDETAVETSVRVSGGSVLVIWGSVEVM